MGEPMGGVHQWGTLKWFVCKGNPMKMEDDWGGPHVWKPPYESTDGLGVCDRGALGGICFCHFLPISKEFVQSGSRKQVETAERRKEKSARKIPCMDAEYPTKSMAQLLR